MDEVAEEASEWLGVAYHTPQEKVQAKTFFAKSATATKMCKVLGGCEDIEVPGKKADIKEFYVVRNSLLYERLKREYTY